MSFGGIKEEDIDRNKYRQALTNNCDDSCVLGYHNDGTTCYENFESGFNLAKRAGNECSVWEVIDCDDGTAYFFICHSNDPLHEIRKRIGWKNTEQEEE